MKALKSIGARASCTRNTCILTTSAMPRPCPSRICLILLSTLTFFSRQMSLELISDLRPHIIDDRVDLIVAHHLTDGWHRPLSSDDDINRIAAGLEVCVFGK